MNTENCLESAVRKLTNIENSDEFLNLYSNIEHEKLKRIFSTLHSEFIRLFEMMNGRLPTKEDSNHFWAQPSRDLIRAIETTLELQQELNNTELAFSIDDYYKKTINSCRSFLVTSGGSSLPPNMDKIRLYYTIPIFLKQDSIAIKTKDDVRNFELTLIGSGSYANVYKYCDDFYDCSFALKRAKKDLNPKELQRFKQEFEQMKLLKSPYIMEVFSYNSERNQYIMEFMDCTLHDYIEKNNNTIDSAFRKNLINQILKAFSYIHSKNILHRDINPKNILLKKYEDIFVVKVSDFGLVKIPNSQLTSKNSEFKGYFNDPELVVEGFSSYTNTHETYALTRLIYYVLTGRTNTNTNDKSIKAFLTKGMNPDKSLRFQNVEEMTIAIKNL